MALKCQLDIEEIEVSAGAPQRNELTQKNSESSVIGLLSSGRRTLKFTKYSLSPQQKSLRKPRRFIVKGYDGEGSY